MVDRWLVLRGSRRFPLFPQALCRLPAHRSPK
jgi:hypothetical protein